MTSRQICFPRSALDSKSPTSRIVAFLILDAATTGSLQPFKHLAICGNRDWPPLSPWKSLGCLCFVFPFATPPRWFSIPVPRRVNEMAPSSSSERHWTSEAGRQRIDERLSSMFMMEPALALWTWCMFAREASFGSFTSCLNSTLEDLSYQRRSAELKNTILPFTNLVLVVYLHRIRSSVNIYLPNLMWRKGFIEGFAKPLEKDNQIWAKGPIARFCHH